MIPVVPTMAELFPEPPSIYSFHDSRFVNRPETKKRTGSLANLAIWLATNRRRSLTPDEASQRIGSLWSLPLVRNSPL